MIRDRKHFICCNHIQIPRTGSFNASIELKNLKIYLLYGNTSPHLNLKTIEKSININNSTWHITLMHLSADTQ